MVILREAAASTRNQTVVESFGGKGTGELEAFQFTPMIPSSDLMVMMKEARRTMRVVIVERGVDWSEDRGSAC